MNQEPNQESPRQSSGDHVKAHRRTPVFAYLAILFAAAFLLLLLAYFQQQRSNQASTEALQQSVSAVESIQLLMEDNDKLRQQVKDLEEQVDTLKGQVTELDSARRTQNNNLDALLDETRAMQWFWQIESAYVKGRTEYAKELIEKFEETGLVSALSAENTTGTQRFSPAARYQEIYDALF